jgi:hypothetical protein
LTLCLQQARKSGRLDVHSTTLQSGSVINTARYDPSMADLNRMAQPL